MSLPPCQRSALYMLCIQIAFIPRPVDDPRSLRGPICREIIFRVGAAADARALYTWLVVEHERTFRTGFSPCAHGRRDLSGQEIVTWSQPMSFAKKVCVNRAHQQTTFFNDLPPDVVNVCHKPCQLKRSDFMILGSLQPVETYQPCVVPMC